MLKIALESLGCSKNLVDAEIMMGILNKKGYKLVGDFEEADIILVNTCGFIESAKQESIQTILELAQLKETANLKLLIVTGCLAQRYAEEVELGVIAKVLKLLTRLPLNLHTGDVLSGELVSILGTL